MLILKRVLGIAMGGTAIWLLYVLAAQAGKFASLVSAAALIVVIVLLAWRHLRPRLRRSGLVAASILALLAPALFAGVAPSAGNAGTDAAWQVFSESALTQLISRGKVVLVDVTADWCINCQVNKALVLDHGWVADQLAAGKIVGLKADWTRPDPEISRYLASFGRYGIPFNAVYGPKAQQGLPLPPVLSESAVREAIGEAGGEAGGG
jgi:suppressor for copper-sensitivity B